MQRLIVLSALVVATLGDVSHLFKPSHGFAPPTAPKQVFQRAPAAPVSAQQYHESNGPQVAILRQEQDNREDGSYEWAYETANGIAAQEQASVRELEGGRSIKSAQGSFQYTSPDGTPIALSYIADENGYQPQGDHLPTPPPIPAAILRALEYLAAHPPPLAESSAQPARFG